MTQKGFRGSQVCSIAGITYRQLDYWARTGLIGPSLEVAKGSGSQRMYSYTDLVELKVIKALLDSGISLQSARKAVECLRGDLQQDLASANLVFTGYKSVLAFSGEEVVDLLQGGQGVLGEVFNIVPLKGVIKELQGSIEKLEPRSVQLNIPESLIP